jgi:hypothetical protein
MLVSKTIKELETKGIISKDSKNSLIVSNPKLLASYLAFMQKRINPIYFQAPDYKDTLTILKKTLYLITSKTAEEIMNGNDPKIIIAHLLENHLEILSKYFNQVLKKDNANLIIYPAKPIKFLTNVTIKGVNLANKWQLMIDCLRNT